MFLLRFDLCTIDWVAISAIATLVMAIVAYVSLKQAKKSSEDYKDLALYTANQQWLQQLRDQFAALSATVNFREFIEYQFYIELENFDEIRKMADIMRRKIKEQLDKVELVFNSSPINDFSPYFERIKTGVVTYLNFIDNVCQLCNAIEMHEALNSQDNPHINLSGKEPADFIKNSILKSTFETKIEEYPMSDLYRKQLGSFFDEVSKFVNSFEVVLQEDFKEINEELKVK